MDWTTVAENPKYETLYAWSKHPDGYQHPLAHRLMDMMTADEFLQWKKSVQIRLTGGSPEPLMDAIDAGLTPTILADLGGYWTPKNHTGAKLAQINARLEGN